VDRVGACVGHPESCVDYEVIDRLPVCVGQRRIEHVLVVDVRVDLFPQREVARLALALEAASSRPVDVECAFRGDALYLLQSRPITTLA